MSGRFVRASKYRHVFGRPTKKEQCYDNLRVSKNAWDTNLIKANPLYLSVNWEASGGGAFAVLPLEERGKLPDRIPLFRGHTAAVCDTDWSPFDDRFIASGSDDGKVFLWKVPQDFSVRPNVPIDEIEDVAPVSKLTGHTRKVGHVMFNPAAKSVLASASGDYSIKIWDVETGNSPLALKHKDIVQSLSWSADGSMLVTTCRDKKLRIWDTRQERPASENQGHSGAKNSRVVWMGEHDRIATTGFSKMSDRQMGLWDARASREPIDGFTILDQISGVCVPFWDSGTQCLYLAGKGDGNIRYYEYDNDKFEYLSQHSSPDPQRGIAFMPKRGVNTHDNEVMRAFRSVNDSYIEPVSFIVPRRAEVFQEDIYPATVGSKPGVSASEWFDGKTALPPKIKMEDMFDGNENPDELPGDYKDPSQDQPIKSASKPTPVETTPTKAVAAEPKPAESPVPVAARAPPPTVNENKASIATMANKFADKDEDDEVEDDETSSFEEVPKPVERPRVVATKPVETTAKAASPVSASPAPGPSPSSGTPTTSAPLPKAADMPSTPAGPTHRATSSGSATAAEGLRSHLADIKSLLESQNRTIQEQGAKIDSLTRTVEALKGQPASGGDASKDERIRQLELELEEARS